MKKIFNFVKNTCLFSSLAVLVLTVTCYCQTTAYGDVSEISEGSVPVTKFKVPAQPKKEIADTVSKPKTDTVQKVKNQSTAKKNNKTKNEPCNVCNSFVVFQEQDVAKCTEVTITDKNGDSHKIMKCPVNKYIKINKNKGN